MGLSNAAFAFGAGVFFLGYAIRGVEQSAAASRGCEAVDVPHHGHVGARVGRHGARAQRHDFYTLRFLLGVAEAGFFHDIVYYLTRWFPQASQACALDVFYFGAPLSGLLLDLHGAFGLKGWQWLFLVQGLPASIVGIWAVWYLDYDPAKARWLTNDQRSHLVSRLAEDARFAASHGPRSVFASLFDARVLVLCCVYFLIRAAVYGVVFYLPQQVSALLGTKVGFRVGVVTALPWVVAVLVTWIVPRYADSTGKHRMCTVGLLLMSGIAICVSGVSTVPFVALVALCCAASGFIAAQPLF